jgi:hypothetical protein
MTHRWELRNLLWYLACEIKLIRSQDDGLLHYVGSAPVRFYEYKKEIIYDLLASYLGVDANVEDFQPYLYKARALRRKNATFFTVKEMLALLELTAESSIGEEGRNQMVKDAVTEPYYDCIATWLDTPEWRRDEKVLQTILSLLEKPRCKDQIALSRHKVYGRLLRFLVKANELSLSTKRMLYSRLALSEALWRRRNPSPNSLDLDQFLRDEMDKLKRAFDVSE